VDEEDPLISEIRTFMDTWADHDPDCPCLTETGPAVRDESLCVCGLNRRQREILEKVTARIARPN
jgi:hypothetical protein